MSNDTQSVKISRALLQRVDACTRLSQKAAVEEALEKYLKEIEKPTLLDQLALSLGMVEQPDHSWRAQDGKIYIETKFGLKLKGG